MLALSSTTSRHGYKHHWVDFTKKEKNNSRFCSELKVDPSQICVFIVLGVINLKKELVVVFSYAKIFCCITGIVLSISVQHGYCGDTKVQFKADLNKREIETKTEYDKDGYRVTDESNKYISPSGRIFEGRYKTIQSTRKDERFQVKDYDTFEIDGFLYYCSQGDTLILPENESPICMHSYRGKQKYYFPIVK